MINKIKNEVLIIFIDDTKRGLIISFNKSFKPLTKKRLGAEPIGGIG